VMNAVESEPSLATCRFSGATLIHFACGAGSLEVVALLARTLTRAEALLARLHCTWRPGGAS
jgi:hypothetical protein